VCLLFDGHWFGCLHAGDPVSYTSFSLQAFARMIKLTADESAKKIETKGGKKEVEVHADDLISFRALRNSEEADVSDDHETMLSKATGSSDTKSADQSKLNRVFQLSGFSDPVYAEAYVHVHQYDILLDVIIVNQTPDTLQNLTLELATLGDLKLTEKTSSHTLAPHDFANIKANVKVSSTETGIIFGNIVYEVAGASLDRNCVVLNDIHIDIMDYISPA
jgi:coatomer subunit beta